MNRKDKTVLITGSTDGVGRLVARRLASQGARLLIHGRDRHRGKQVVEQIQAEGTGSAVFLPADFSSLAEVRRLAKAVRQTSNRLDVLINNAGIGSGGAASKRETSQEGHELRFAVNYLAGFLLTRLLLPLMMVSKPARIVNVFSLGQHPIDFDDVMLTRGYTGGRAYAQSKLAQIMFTFDLARELIQRQSRQTACIQRLTWQQQWCGRAGSLRSAPSTKERKRSSTSRFRKNSMVIPANSTMD